MTSIFEGQPPKTRVIWVPGIYIYYDVETISNISRSLWITSPGSKSPQGEAMDGQGCDIFVGNLGHFSIRKPI